jgi:hypothetical protein
MGFLDLTCDDVQSDLDAAKPLIKALFPKEAV